MKLPLLLLIFALGCTNCTKEKPTPNPPLPTPAFALEKVTVASGFTQPWGMVFISPTQMLVTEKSGQILLVDVSTGEKKVAAHVPGAVSFGQGGLLDIALHPNFTQNKQLYVTYTKAVSGGYTTALARAIYQNELVSSFEEIFVAQAAGTAGVHFGSRLAFDDQGKLYMTIGDRGGMQQAQNTLNHKGCVLRLNDDGTVPANNPFVGNNLFLAEIFAYGTRNAQGLTKHPQTGAIWSHEHGPQGGDEINKIEAGANYGWPLVTFGVQYGGGTISTDTAGEGLTQPKHYWSPSIAPCGMVFINGNTYPGWEGSLLSGSLVLQHLNRTVFVNNKLTEEHRYFVGQGRIRNVVQAPDGYIYMANESDGTITKLVPVF